MLGISAIGWKDEEEHEILSANAGAFNFIELVPSRIFARNEDFGDIAKRYREDYGLWAYSAQALFYDSAVQSFEDTAAAQEHLLRVVRLGSLMGIKRFVLGSPALRRGSPSSLMETLKRTTPSFALNPLLKHLVESISIQSRRLSITLIFTICTT